MPDNTVLVSRPGPFGNPFRVGDPYPGGDGVIQDATEAVALFALHPAASHIRARAKELSGKNLACWCTAESYCHADVLLQLANF